ncbi:MAG: DNA mismatch repair endonuclease MutL [Planctomycetota bacterium]
MESAAEIKSLDRVIVDQIAAGEVVERPASVVRELLDNAIDAGATSIEIQIDGGGRTLIRVSDNGSGIRYKDLSLAFASHATSKLRGVDDLQQIATLGFRGEALASIGSVSRARIRSFAAGEKHGGEIDNEGGMVTAPRPAARARGTDVEVCDLFYNIPARRRFLKRGSTETGHALEAILRQALAHPEISIRAVADGKVIYDFPAAGSLASGSFVSDREVAAARADRVRRAFGAQIAEDMTPFFVKTSSLQLDGLLGGPNSARNDSSGIYFYINGRYVRDRGALSVIRSASREFLGSRQPVAFIFLSIDPSAVDVNVHPAKLEVRFREAPAIYGPLHREIVKTYQLSRPAASPDVLLENAAEMLTIDSGAAASFVRDREMRYSRESYQNAFSFYNSSGAQPSVPRASRYLRAFDTFIVLESEHGLDFVDQHALHERVNFEDLKSRQGDGGSPKQPLLVSEAVQLTAEEAALVEEYKDLWSAAGFDVELYGRNSVAIRALPLGMKRIRPSDLLRDLITLSRENRAPSQQELLEEVLHRCACHASVKAGDKLSDDEIDYLLKRASQLPVEQTCPHGRPTRIRLTLRDLERAFERK